jgi:heme exporter protein D
MKEEEREQAYVELKLLSVVISRRESAVYAKQNWLFTLISALSLAFLKNEPYLDGIEYLTIGLSLVAIFFVSEIIQRVPIMRAIDRSQKIEEQLREDKAWDGILMSEYLAKGKDWKDFFSFFYKIRIWAPFAMIACLVVALFYMRNN